jgi:pentatricopeptide repeat protein
MLVWKMLNTCAEKGEVEKVKELFSLLKERGLTPVNNVVLGPLVKAYIVKYVQYKSSS